jgi:hypothetical protein
VEENKNKLSYFSQSTEKTVQVTAITDGGIPVSVAIKPGSIFWPNTALGVVASIFNLSVSIRKAPISPNKFQEMDRKDDLIAWSSAKNNDLILDISQQTLNILSMHEIQKDFLSGRITAVPDLLGAQLFLSPPRDVRNERYDYSEIQEIIKSVELEMVVITVSEGRQFQIEGSKFKRTKDNSGYSVFSIVLPETEDGLRALFR